MSAITNIVYLSYGKEAEHQRALFAILSADSWYDGQREALRIVLYTDKPDVFKPYLGNVNIEYFTLTPAILENMLAETEYVHRRKVAVIQLTAERYPKENLIFIDSDTFFIAKAEVLFSEISSSRSLMHKLEYNIGDGLAMFNAFNQAAHPQAFVDYISKNDFTIDGTKEQFSTADYCWNSGVLGLHVDFYKYLSDVMVMTDLFYRNSKWFISEQLAFSFTLQRKTAIKATDGIILHYWGKRQKVLVDAYLRELFKNKSIDKLKEKSYIKHLTGNWRKAVDNDVIIEQAVLSIASKAWYSAFKKVVKLTLKNPFNFKFYLDIRNELKLL